MKRGFVHILGTKIYKDNITN